MTRPDEPTEALPTRALPVTPPGDADTAEPTVHLVAPRATTEAEPAVSLSAVSAEPTVALSVDGAEPTVPRAATADTGDAEPTVQLVRPEAEQPPAAEPTVHLSPIPAEDDRTADLTGPAASAPAAGEPTGVPRPATDSSAEEATADLRSGAQSEVTAQTPASGNAAGEPTVSLGPVPGDTAGEPTAHLPASGSTAGEATARLRPAPADEATTQLRHVPDDAAGEPTVSLRPAVGGPAEEPTVSLRPLPEGAVGEATVHLRQAQAPTPASAPAPALTQPQPQAPAQATAPTPARGTATGQATVRPRPAPPTRGPGVEPTVSWQPTGVPHGHQAGGPPTATGVGAYPDRTVGARAVSGAPAPAPGGELRFGPGVPVTPPPAPPWPTAPPIRPRPVWRRVVSVLSTLLAAALLLTVGLYLWQRLRPMEVEQVSVAATRPAGVACDVTVDVVATVRTNGRAGTIRYQWFRSDAPPGAVLTERVGSGQHTATLTLKWTFSGVGTTAGTATVNIIEPAPMQAGARVRYRCPGG
ncbi:hypothetical protein AB0K27_28395 [Micromonospora echinospora]|uniref:hypothetical protein n=1 Tax=Micromonospora echinospora TaxID=1877 RepID=UPI003415EC9B